VAEWEESLDGSWRHVTWTILVISVAIEMSASNLSISTITKVIGRLWRGRVQRQKLLMAHGSMTGLFRPRKDGSDTMLRFVYKFKI
jgi:hypothetical protein